MRRGAQAARARGRRSLYRCFLQGAFADKGARLQGRGDSARLQERCGAAVAGGGAADVSGAHFGGIVGLWGGIEDFSSQIEEGGLRTVGRGLWHNYECTRCEGY